MLGTTRRPQQPESPHLAPTETKHPDASVEERTGTLQQALYLPEPSEEEASELAVDPLCRVLNIWLSAKSLAVGKALDSGSDTNLNRLDVYMSK